MVMTTTRSRRSLSFAWIARQDYAAFAGNQITQCTVLNANNSTTENVSWVHTINSSKNVTAVKRKDSAPATYLASCAIGVSRIAE